MAKDMADLEQEAKRLPADKRAQLAQSLIASLDSEDDTDAEAAWLAEAESRYEAYRRGLLAAKPAADVFRESRGKLK
jgi:putative addiction module component (TIGR02574 family)